MPRKKITKTKTNPQTSATKCQTYVSKKIPILKKEGYKGQQAVAIAYSYGRKKGLCKK